MLRQGKAAPPPQDDESESIAKGFNQRKHLIFLTG